MQKQSDTSPTPFTLLCSVITLMVGAQLLSKVASSSLIKPQVYSLSEIARVAVHNILNPFVICSLGLTFVAGICWIAVIQKMPMSRAYPFLSLNFFIVYLLSWPLFGEQPTMTSLIGISFIGVGVVFLHTGKVEQVHMRGACKTDDEVARVGKQTKGRRGGTRPGA